MDFWGDRRGQPVQIGFILLFGILVLAFASYQGYVVPNQNAQIEFQHAQTIEDQFTEFDTNVVNTIGNDVERSSSFDLSVQYPSRLIALNPPPIQGRLETTAPRRVAIVNDTGASKTADICGSAQATSRSLVYTPQYNEYQEVRSTTYENTFVTRSFRERDLHVDQRLVRTVDGTNRIDLLLLNRSVSVDRQGTYSLKIEGSHRYSKTVENATVTISTQFSSSAWEEDILSDREDVNATDAGTDQVNLTFDGGDYEVSCAVVGLNGEPEFVSPGSANGEEGSTFDTRWIQVNGVPIDESSVTANPGDNVTLTAEILGSDSGNPITDKPLSCDDVDIAGDTEAFGSCGPSTGFTTNQQGRVAVNVEIADSNSASDGDSLEVYITAGDNSDIVVIEVAEDRPPTATIDDIRDNSDCDLNQGENCPGSADFDYAEFEVDWSATDDKDIQSVTLELVDDGGTVVNSTNPPASGTTSSGTETLRHEGGYEDDYTIRLIVMDSKGQEDIDTRADITANGNDP